MHLPGMPRRGTTLVELLIALVIVTVGLLALAGAAAVVAREVGTGRREVAVAAAARNRLEQLTSAPCRSLMDGAAASGGITERWTISSAPNGMRRIAVRAEATAAGARAPLVRQLDALVSCT